MLSLEASGRNMSTMLCMLNLLSDLFEIITPSHDFMCLNENMNTQNIPFKISLLFWLMMTKNTSFVLVKYIIF